jgi:hypothetical protein
LRESDKLIVTSAAVVDTTPIAPFRRDPSIKYKFVTVTNDKGILEGRYLPDL